MSPIRHLIEGLLKGDLVQIPAAQQPNSNQHLMPYLDHLDTIKVFLYLDNPDHMAGILQDTVNSHQCRWDSDQG